VAGGLGSAGAEQGRERGKRERERDSNLKFFSKISFEAWKTLNMKVIEIFEFYTFRFRHQFV